MAITQITAGQKDWLKVLNSNDQANHLTVIKTTATLINGWSGVINLYRIDADGFRLYEVDGYLNLPPNTTLNRGAKAEVSTFGGVFDEMKGLILPLSGYVVTGDMVFDPADNKIKIYGGLENVTAGTTTFQFAGSLCKN